MKAFSQRDIDLVKLAFGQFFGVFLPYIFFVAIEFSPQDRATGYDYLYYVLVCAVISLTVYFMAFHFQRKVILNTHVFPKCESDVHHDFILILGGNRCWQYLTPILGFWWFDNPPKLYKEVKAALVEF